MGKNFIAKSSILIDAPPSQVWEALTNPKMIKQYLFGTDAISDWKVGNPIIYRGIWNGKSYEDKGTILSVVPEKLLVSTYWSSMSGLADSPENYKKVTYQLTLENNQTMLTISNDNNATKEDRDHSAKNWDMVLSALKKLLEK